MTWKEYYNTITADERNKMKLFVESIYEAVKGERCRKEIIARFKIDCLLPVSGGIFSRRSVSDQYDTYTIAFLSLREGYYIIKNLKKACNTLVFHTRSDASRFFHENKNLIHDLNNSYDCLYFEGEVIK